MGAFCYPGKVNQGFGGSGDRGDDIAITNDLFRILTGLDDNSETIAVFAAELVQSFGIAGHYLNLRDGPNAAECFQLPHRLPARAEQSDLGRIVAA